MREPLQDLLAPFRTAKTLQQLLNDQPGREHRLPVLRGKGECADFRNRRYRIAPERQRPHAGIDEEVQRERSVL